MKNNMKGDSMENQEKVIIEEIKDQPKPEWQGKIEKMLHETYLMGLSNGGKTFVGLVYEMIKEDRKKKANPAKTVLRVEAACRKMLGMEDYNTVEDDNIDNKEE